MNPSAGPTPRNISWTWTTPSPASPPRSRSKAELVTLRFFGGMTTPEAAAAIGVSVPTAERWWTFALAWLLADLDGDDSEKSVMESMHRFRLQGYRPDPEPFP